MWAQQLVGPGQLELVEVAEPDEVPEGRVLLRFLSGAICGSDLPKFLGVPDPLLGGAAPPPGHPMHEVVAEVVQSRAPGFEVGTRVVGFATDSCGLAEYFINRPDQLLPLDSTLSDEHAVVIQSMSTVLSALSRVQNIDGSRAAVIGQGPLGLLFSHALKSQGAREVIGVDRLDRSDVPKNFGIDVSVWQTSEQWARALSDDERPEIVIEAVGHQVATLNDAVEAVRHKGQIFAFGVPDSTHYPFTFQRFFRKNLTLHAGNIQDWPRFLAEAEVYLETHRELAQSYISHTITADRAQLAFETALTSAKGRLKVVLTPPIARA